MNQKRGAMEQRRKRVIFYIPNGWLRDVLSQLLSEEEYEVISSEAKLDHYAAEVAVIDVGAYQRNCRQLFAEIRNRFPGVAILALLSEHTPDYPEKIMQMGANGIVWKEDADRTFLSAVEKAIDGVHLKHRSQRKVHGTVSQVKEGTKVQEKRNESIFQKPISRRSFLVGSAAAAAALTLTACAADAGVTTAPETTEEETTTAAVKPEVVVPEEKIYYGSCRGNCLGGCRMKITVRDGKVVKTGMAEFPDKRYNRICTKGLSHVQRIYGPDRLKYPMRRVGERGAGQWEQITWDEAITEIADTWKKMQAEYGDTSVSFGALSGNMSNITKTAPTRLMNLMGGTNIMSVLDQAVLYSVKNVLGLNDFYSGSEATDVLNAKSVLIWGANPADAQVQNWKFLREAQKAGAKLIVIDPNYTSTASKADYFVPIKPGTDSVLAMAMMNIIIENGWTDETFLKNRSVAPFLVKESDGKYLRLSEVTGEAPAEGVADPIVVWDVAADTWGNSAEVADPALNGAHEINGIKVNTAYDLLINRIKQYTPTYAAEFCDLPEDMIYEITEVFVKNAPATVYHGFGPDHYANGHYAVFAACCLAILTGNIGKPGAGCGFPLPIGMFFNSKLGSPEGAKGNLTVPSIVLPKVMEEKEFLGTPVDIHSMYIWNGNPLGNVVARTEQLEAMKKIDFLVVADLTMTDTAQYADIVLPVAHWFEVNDCHGVYSQVPYLMLQEKAIEPLYECKSDLDIVSAIAEKMGYGDYFQMTDMEWIQQSLDSDYARMLSLTYERLLEERVLRDVPEGDYIQGAETLSTATGRAQFYLEDPVPNMNVGQQLIFEKERLPYWEAPKEAWEDNPLAEKYLLIFGQERPKYRVHTQWGTTPWLLELDPEPIVKINPIDADARGIAAGDVVKVYNDRGYVVLKAVISKGTRPGMIVMPKGWQRGQFIEGHYQDLTASVYNEACVNGCFYDALVEVVKM